MSVMDEIVDFESFFDGAQFFKNHPEAIEVSNFFIRCTDVGRIRQKSSGINEWTVGDRENNL